jgi:hypothetical protein
MRLHKRFEQLLNSYNCKPIRNCPGRFLIIDIDSGCSPNQLLEIDLEFEEHRVEKAKDAVIVVEFSDGGLITYKREDGSYLHTLNTPEGFKRKLLQLGISKT